MSDQVLLKVREAFGAAAVGQDASGRPRLVPGHSDEIARALSLASEQGWQVRVEGRGTWMPSDAPADLVISTAGLDRIVTVAPGDLMATIEAGASLGAVSGHLAERHVWLTWDPPGRPDRSLGSIVATGTAGPLRHRFGPIRDHLLGCTVVTGDGRVVRPGGKVVKNVAGYDLTRFMAGGFGAFGAVTELHLRLRALPEADRTFLATGPRDALSSAGRNLVGAAIEGSALELLSPGLTGLAEWGLALRLTGTAEGVEDEVHRARALTECTWADLDTGQARALWDEAALGAQRGSVTFRLGVLLEGIDDAIDLLAQHADAILVSAGAGSGSLRWSGDVSHEQLMAIRHAAAAREIPLTLERAPWPLRSAFGHFGAYREGVGNLVTKLRETFDPKRVLQVAVDG